MAHAHWRRLSVPRRAAPRSRLPPRAGELLREANELAPGRYESVRGVAIQHMMESDFDGARAVIDAYVAQYSDAERHFRDILEQMEPDDGS